MCRGYACELISEEAYLDGTILSERNWKKKKKRDFPGGTVVKNPPANAGTRVQTLVREDPTYRIATKPVCHNYCVCTPRARAPQQKKPTQ